MAVSGGNCHFCSSIRQPNLFKVLGAVSGTADAAFISRQASIKCGRANLLKNAWHFFLDSYGFGVGAGNVSYYLEHNALYDTDNVAEVHNWLVEILTNFGLFIMLGYLAVYAYLIWVLYKFYERKLENQSKLITEGLITALVSFLVSSISPSSVSNLFFHWVFLALVIAAVNVLRRSRQMPEPMYR